MATVLKLRSDIKKLKKAIDTKGISAAIKVKLRTQLEKAENELASMQKGGKPRKVSTTKGTATTLTALQKLIKRKKYGVYQGKGVDLKKDAGEGAMAIGRRESKGLKSNQFGSKSENKGNVYYEYRPNRLDVKQPSKKAKYPKLEKGGETSSKRFNIMHNVGKAKYVINYHDGEKTHKDGSPFYDIATFKNIKDFLAFKKKLIADGYKEEYAKGGMTATKANSIFKEYEENEENNDHTENVVLLAKHFGTPKDLLLAKNIQRKHNAIGSLPSDLRKQRDELSDKLYPMLIAAKKKVDGVMAKGGQVSGKFRFVPYKSQGDMLVSTKLEGVSPDNVMVKGLEGKLKGDDFNSAEYVANIILEEHPNIDMVQIIKVGASVLKNKKVAAIKRDSDNSSSFKVEYFEEGGVMAKGGKTIGHTMYFVPQKNLGGKSIQSDSDIRGNYKHMDAVLDKKLGNNYLGSTFYINDGYGKIALEDDKKVAQIKSILEMFDFEDATSKYSKEKGGYMAMGGMVAGRYYKDAAGNELRFIGESGGMGLFRDKDGNAIKKDFSDFINAPKETKLFGWFGNGGEIKITEDAYGKSAFVPYMGKNFLVEWTGDKPKKDDVMISDSGFGLVDKASSTFNNILQGLLKSISEQKVVYLEKGGYNTGASWTADRARHNKSEDYEIPMNKRKLEDGGVISKTHKIG